MVPATAPEGRKWWSQPVVIVGVALLLRALWSALVPIAPVSDGVVYDAFARSLASGHGYAFPDGTLTEYWPVGTSAAYGLLYAIFGLHYAVLATFQTLLGALIVALTWRLARPLGYRSAAIAGWLTALWPLLIEFTTVLASELLFVALLLLAVNVWLAVRIPPVYRLILWGALIAAATYVRPTAWPLLLIFPLAQWLLEPKAATLWRSLLIPLVTAAALFAPWAYRSQVLFGKPVLVAANGGVNLWMGNNAAADGGYMELPDKPFHSEVERDQYYGHEAVKYVLTHPLNYLRLSLRRAATTYARETIGVAWNQKSLEARYDERAVKALKLVSSVYWWALLLLGLVGLVGMVRARLLRSHWELVVACGYFALFPILTVAMDRYHVPIDPFLAIFAAYALSRERRAAASTLGAARLRA
jgi:hypothetical protein